MVGSYSVKHTYVMIQSLIPCKTSETLITECIGNFSRTVRAEIKENNGVIILNRCHRNAVSFYHRRKYELIRGILIVGSLDPCRAALPARLRRYTSAR